MASMMYRDIDSLAEPSLDELFAEPIIQLFMKRDGINPTDMRGELSRVERDYWAQAAV